MKTESASLSDVPAIIDQLEKSRFNFLDLQWGELRITLGEQVSEPRAVPAPAPVSVASHPPVTGAVSASPSAPVVQASPATAYDGLPIKSPMVGRFYARPEPGAEPFVKVGDRVTADTTIGLIEVMKVFNAVSAGLAGEVTALAVKEGEFVEFDQPLAYVRT